MPQARKSQYTVLNDLKALSIEADKIADEFNHKAVLHSWFQSCKETVIKIKNCKTVKEVRSIEFPPGIVTVLKPQNNSNKSDAAELAETQKEHVHVGKHSTSVHGNNLVAEAKQTTETKSSQIDGSFAKKDATPYSTCINHIKTEDVNTEDGELEKESKNGCHLMKKLIKSQQLSEDGTPQTPFMQKKNCLVNAVCYSQELLHTPVANKNFNILNTTVELNSSDKSNNDSNKGLNNSTVIISKSESKVATNERSGDTQEDKVILYTRSQSKRKSQECNTGSNKKQKLDSYDTSATKGVKRKYPITGKTMVTKTASTYENKAKVSAVIVPTMQMKQTPVISKEKQILEEIRKKEDKTNENRKRVLAERQMKAEETKKKREEKQEKVLQKRLQLEKEKQQREMELKKSAVKAATSALKKSTMKTRVKALIEESTVKEKKSLVLTSSKQNESSGGVPPPKTPVSKKSFDSENYELTPMPNSSTYDFSEDEEDKPSGKPIPTWAQGVHLKSALIEQFYYPPDTDELFGTYIESPDLTELFGVHKKCYKLRTSSAIWNSPPTSILKT